MLLTQIGKKIQALRKDTGLSQEKFALKIDMDRTYLASVEAGNRNISIKNLKKITDGLSIPLSKFFQQIEHQG
ncbi:helix-turn-helix domain-containing protein [Neisseria polysaccharea]|uniref:Helix-turn-helix transcriptional regulator n=1 Tax=Neisseria polysaccharea TaxID=489 RepID=A0ABV1JL78_NEIPO|nr:helix-turn-helix transcriptional regulator [Neisseria polysaccharea]